MVKQSPALPRGFAHDGDAVALSQRLYLAPTGIVAGAAATGDGILPLAGGPLAFTACVVLLRRQNEILQSLATITRILEWSAAEGEPVASHVARWLRLLGGRREPFAGLDLARPIVMGVINATPDSFSDGGRYFAEKDAVAHGQSLLEAGADILDVGGESTRPGAEPLTVDQEMTRIVPVIRALAGRGALVSVDTRHACVMAAAVEAGATIINDVTGLEGDPDSLRVVARLRTPVILMHMQGDPRTMQRAPFYSFAPLDVFDYLGARVAVCLDAGVRISDICVDPGIGFGKTLDHNRDILSLLGLLHGTGCAVLLGASRKSFIASLAGGVPPDRRLPGSLAGAIAGVAQGAQIVRVHDVAETVQALAVWRAARVGADHDATT